MNGYAEYYKRVDKGIYVTTETMVEAIDPRSMTVVSVTTHADGRALKATVEIKRFNARSLYYARLHYRGGSEADFIRLRNRAIGIAVMAKEPHTFLDIKNEEPCA